MTDRARDLAERIDRLVLDPDAIRAPLLRLARPILATIGWAATVDATAARRLVDLARAKERDPAQLIGTVGGTALSRKADAIDLLERLLPDARLTPASWDSILETHAGAVKSALGAVHAAV